MKKSTMQAIDNLRNGKLSEFKNWVRKARKIDLLDAIEFYNGGYGFSYEIKKAIRKCLDGSLD